METRTTETDVIMAIFVWAKQGGHFSSSNQLGQKP